MKGVVAVVILVAVSAVALFVTKPWEGRRYDDTPEGLEARKIDKHVQFAKDWRPPNTWEAREYLGPTEPDAKGPGKDYGRLDWGDTKKLVDDLYAAGATEVAYMNIKRSVRFGDQPEAIFVALPDDEAKRQALFTRAGKYYAEVGDKAPEDKRQKYLYFGFGEWTPEQEEPGFMPD